MIAQKRDNYGRFLPFSGISKLKRIKKQYILVRDNKGRFLPLGFYNPEIIIQTRMKHDSNEYNKIHNWIRERKQKPEFCEDCKIVKPKELHCVNHNYIRDIDEFVWLCKSCHIKRMNRTVNGRFYGEENESNM